MHTKKQIIDELRMHIRWALADCRIHRGYMRDEAACGRGITVNSSPSWRWCLRDDQQRLLRLRHQRSALVSVEVAA